MLCHNKDIIYLIIDLVIASSLITAPTASICQIIYTEKDDVFLTQGYSSLLARVKGDSHS